MSVGSCTGQYTQVRRLDAIAIYHRIADQFPNQGMATTSELCLFSQLISKQGFASTRDS
jgi:hypothetical protein